MSEDPKDPMHNDQDQAASSRGEPGVPHPDSQTGTSHPGGENAATQLGSDSNTDDLLALLPKHTVVRITGNNRTKQAYIGQRAVVKRAVGLGGWHWLVLSSNEEIKLQRNALLVLEHPTGNEADFSEEEEEEEAAPQAHTAGPSIHFSSQSQPSQRAAAPRATAPAPESPSPRRATLQRAASIPRINLNKLDIAALRRYRARYCLPGTGPHASKEQLVVAVAEHLHAQDMDEMTVLFNFRAAAARKKAT